MAYDGKKGWAGQELPASRGLVTKGDEIFTNALSWAGFWNGGVRGNGKSGCRNGDDFIRRPVQGGGTEPGHSCHLDPSSGHRVSVRRVIGDYSEVETMDHRRGYVPTAVLEDQ